MYSLDYPQSRPSALSTPSKEIPNEHHEIKDTRRHGNNSIVKYDYVNYELDSTKNAPTKKRNTLFIEPAS